MNALVSLLITLCLAVAACDDTGRRCHFGSDHSVFSSSTPQFDDVALVQLSSNPLAVFSEASGLFIRELDAYGMPRQRAERLADRCDAGLAAVVSGAELWVACGRRPTGAGTHGAVTLYRRRTTVEVLRRFGPLGAESHGVSLAVQGERAVVVWQDAAVGGAQLWYGDTSRPDARVLSDPEWFASTPQVVVSGAQMLAIWDETQEHTGSFESRIRMQVLSGSVYAAGAKTVAEGHDASPSPAVAAEARGMWLAFRDRRREHRKAGLYLSRLDGAGRRTAEARIGRADGVGRPTLTSCLSGLVAATPRTFAGDYFVGVVHAPYDLGAISLEQQFYEDSHEFSQVAAACLGARALLLIAERGRPGDGGASLRSVGFACE